MLFYIFLHYIFYITFLAVCFRLISYTYKITCFSIRGLYPEQHGGGLQNDVCAPRAAVEASVLLLHTCQVQADIKGVGAGEPAPVTIVLSHWASFNPAAHPDDAPGLVVVWYPLQSHIVDSVVMLVVTEDCCVAVLLCYQLGIHTDHVLGLWTVAVFFFFWGFIYKQDTRWESEICVVEIKPIIITILGYEIGGFRVLNRQLKQRKWGETLTDQVGGSK